MVSSIVYTRVVSHGIQLTVRYLVGVRTRWSSEEQLWEEILRAFAQQPDINFAYPTQRFYYNSLKGQPPAPPGGPKEDTSTVEIGSEFELE
jgi:hypothetical protein